MCVCVCMKKVRYAYIRVVTTIWKSSVTENECLVGFKCSSTAIVIEKIYLLQTFFLEGRPENNYKYFICILLNMQTNVRGSV